MFNAVYRFYWLRPHLFSNVGIRNDDKSSAIISQEMGVSCKSSQDILSRGMPH
jgi:hypothetical protein